MSKRLLFYGLVVLVALSVLVGVASAAPPTPVSGTYGIVDAYGIPEMRDAGGNCFLVVDAEYPFSGDLDGVATAHFDAIVHGPCELALPFAFRENYHATGTFVGSVLGHEGTFDFVYSGRGWPGEPGEAVLSSRINVLSGTGELENLHGNLDIVYYLGDTVDYYTGQMHFAP